MSEWLILLLAGLALAFLSEYATKKLELLLQTDEQSGGTPEDQAGSAIPAAQGGSGEAGSAPDDFPSDKSP